MRSFDRLGAARCLDEPERLAEHDDHHVVRIQEIRELSRQQQGG